MQSLSHHEYLQALAAVEDDSVAILDKVEMLMQIAMGLQNKPKEPKQLFDAVELYDRALCLCPDEEWLLKARLRARKATALYMLPVEGFEFLLQAKDEMEAVLPLFEKSVKEEHPGSASKEELAEIEMNFGLVLQSLASYRKAKITDSIFWYQRALRVFDRVNHPAEYAILHNNLATAYLSIPLNDEKAKMREALAVQSFEAALEVVTIEDMPSEYAMLQNNLGNALQYASSSHAVENNLRALKAYDEALKVRDVRVSPLAYANTIANKANCLRNLPDDPENPEGGNSSRVAESLKLYQEARKLFSQYGEEAKVEIVSQVIAELESLDNGRK